MENPFYFVDSTAARFYVTSAGNIWPSDHGTITSDETLKENIVDAPPKLADIMKLKVRNFNWKKSYKPNTPEKMLGFIAQEVEEVFPSLIKESDIAPRTSAKDDENHVSNMKKSAYIFNLSRGPVINESHLENALEAKEIAGAGLDVTEKEPLSTDSKLLKYENVIITPHALCWTDECFNDIATEAINSILNYIDKKPILNQVNK